MPDRLCGRSSALSCCRLPRFRRTFSVPPQGSTKTPKCALHPQCLTCRATWYSWRSTRRAIARSDSNSCWIHPRRQWLRLQTRLSHLDPRQSTVSSSHKVQLHLFGASCCCCCCFPESVVRSIVYACRGKWKNITYRIGTQVVCLSLSLPVAEGRKARTKAIEAHQEELS